MTVAGWQIADADGPGIPAQRIPDPDPPSRIDYTVSATLLKRQSGDASVDGVVS